MAVFFHIGSIWSPVASYNFPQRSKTWSNYTVHFWGEGVSRFSFSIGLCPLAPSLNSIPSLSISSREAECPCDKVWGLSASDWQACSHHASACCLIRENVSVILGNVIYRSFLAVSVTQTDYGCWTFISLGVAWKIVQMLCFSVITALNIPFAVMDLILFPHLFSLVWIVSTSYAALASLFYEACIRHHQSVWHVEAFRSGIHSTPRQRLPPLRIVQNLWVEVCVCGAPDSSDNLLVFVVVCVWAAWWVGDILLYYLERQSPPPKRWVG